MPFFNIDITQLLCNNVLAGRALNGLSTGDWNTTALENEVADSIFFTGVFMFIAAGINALKYIYRADPYPKPMGYRMANKGHSSGRIEPRNLKHQLALEQSISAPNAGTPIPITMNDTRWAQELGWKKMQQEFTFYNGEHITIHYVINESLMLIDDFKIKYIK